MEMHLECLLFEELSLEELYAILRLRMDVFVVEQKCPYPELDGIDAAAHHVILKEKNAIIAYARIHYFSSYAKISRVVVQSDRRKKGFAKLVMLYCLDEISRKESELFSIKLSAQCYLQKFYEDFGFKSSGVDYLEDGIPHVDMERIS